MRPGGGREKGAGFERETGTKLSLWVSEGHRGDLFTRNKLSGGGFTNAVKRGDAEHGNPGDLMAAHPLAFTFLTSFFVECKHYADLNFEAFLFDFEDKSLLGGFLRLARKQAQHAGLWPLLIARQNRRPTMVLCDADIGEAMLLSLGKRAMPPRHHILHSGRTVMLPFEAMLASVPPGRFLAQVEKLRDYQCC